MSHKDEELLQLYCMRLEDCVQRAYPHDPKLRRKELKKKLWDSLQHFVTSLEELQEVKFLTPGSKTLSWGDIVARAEQMDKAKRRVVCKRSSSEEVFRDEGNDVMWRNVLPRSSNEEVFRGGGKEVMWSNVNPRFINKCEHCLKVGYTIDICRSRLGTCLLCGSNEHWVRGCYRFREIN